MANFHKIDIQNIAIKMANGDIEAKNKLIEHYTNYINKIIQTNFNDFNHDKERLKNEMIKIMHESIDTYTNEQSEYFSHYITRKIGQYYFNELRKLNNKQEYKNREIQKLALKMINGDNDALNKIIEFYTYHITKLVKEKYCHVNYEEEDLIQIGIIGLLKAIEVYKLNPTHHFCSYANTYIRNEFESELNSINKTPNVEYIGLTNNYNSFTFDDFIEDIEVKEAIKKLSDVKKKILFLYTYGKYSFVDISNILGFSYQRAQEHYKRSIELIKTELNLPNIKS